MDEPFRDKCLNEVDGVVDMVLWRVYEAAEEGSVARRHLDAVNIDSYIVWWSYVIFSQGKLVPREDIGAPVYRRPCD